MIWYGTFKDLKAPAWIKWMRQNRSKIDDAQVSGSKYIETYLTINGTADHDFEMWFEIDNWEVLDRDRGNQKVVEINKEIFKEMGLTFDWTRTRFLRTVDDVIFLDFEE
jgi:hypothetical protein